MPDKKPANDTAGLDLLRQPFEPHLISKLPKPTKAQTDAVKADYKKGIRCKECGQWHHPDVVHLDYVGHAALTDRLLECDPFWNWEPQGRDEFGLPLFDRNGGLWINLTVCGVTRPGYGDADGKTGGNAVKEAIGDAMRNAAMRFGAALDLWHKGELHPDMPDEGSGMGTTQEDCEVSPTAPISDADWSKIVSLCQATNTKGEEVKAHIDAVNLKVLSDEQLEAAFSYLNDKLAKMAKAETDEKAKEPA